DTPFIDKIFVYDALQTFPLFLEALATCRKSVSLISHTARYQINRSVNDPHAPATLPLSALCNEYFARSSYGCANPVNLIQMTAGCAYRCSYCSIPSRQLKYVKRSIETVLTDIETTKAQDILPIDANALQDIEYSRRLYREIGAA